MNNEESILLTKSIPRLFLKYSIPAVIAMVITGAQGIIDGAFVGNQLGEHALAGVNIASPFMQLIIGLSMVVSIGAQSYISIKLGMNETQEAKDTFKTFLKFLITGALFISLIGIFFSKNIATILGADEVLIEGSSGYIQVISIFAVPMCLMFYFGFLDRILEKPQLYFWGTILSLVINIVLDAVLLVKFKLGVQAAAFATGMAYMGALIIVSRPYFNKKSILNLWVGKFSKHHIKPVLYNGASEGINSVSTAIALFLFNTALMKIAGADGVAAFTTINYIAVFGTLLLFGVSDGIGPIVSYNFGANESARIRKIMTIGYVSNLIIGVVVFILLYFCGKPLIELFINNNKELVQMAVEGGKLYAFTFMFSGINILNSGYFTFVGRGFESVIVAASRGIIFISIGMYVLPQFMGIKGVWLAVPFAESVALIIGIYLLNKSKMDRFKTKDIS